MRPHGKTMFGPKRFEMMWRHPDDKAVCRRTNGLVYLEEARMCRAVFVKDERDEDGSLRNIRTPALAIVHTFIMERGGERYHNNVHALRVWEGGPVQATTFHKRVFSTFWPHLCIGPGAVDMLKRKEITAPEAVWMTAWSEDDMYDMYYWDDKYDDTRPRMSLDHYFTKTNEFTFADFRWKEE